MRIGFIGNDTPYKGLPLLLQVLKRITDKSSWRLDVWGGKVAQEKDWQIFYRGKFDSRSLATVYDRLGSLKSVHVTKGGKEYLMYINFKTEAEIKKRICDFAENESIRVTAEINKISEPISAIVIRHYYDGLSVGYSFMIKTTDANSKNIMEEYIDGEDHDFNVLLTCVSENKRDRYFSMGDTEFTDKMKRLMSEHVNKFGFELLVEEID